MSNDSAHLLAESGALLAMLTETPKEDVVDWASRAVPLQTVEQRIATVTPLLTEDHSGLGPADEREDRGDSPALQG